MKKKFFSLLACFVMSICFLVGCGATALSGGPSLTDTVYGNGSVAVRKGEYLYFVNAYSTKALGYGDNKYGKETLSAIYRTKLNDNGVVNTDEDGMPIGAEVVAKQIAGFANSGLYIFGNYIYYATPTATKDDGGNEITGLVSFERVKLDGTDHKKIYSISSIGTDFKYQIYQSNNRVYILVLNNSKIISSSVAVNGSKVTTKTLQEDVTSAVFPSTTTVTSDYVSSDFNNYVYFTRATTLEDDGIENYNYIGKIKIDGSQKAEEIKLTENTYTLSEIKNNRLYYTLDGIVYSSNLKDGNIDNATQYSYNSLTSYKVVEDQIIGDTSTDLGIVAILNNSLIYYKGLNNYINLVDGSEKAVTLQYVSGNYVYYTIADDTALYRKVIYKTRTQEEIEQEKSLPGELVIDQFVPTVGATTDDSGNTTGGTTLFDYDNDYLFFFNTVENSNKINSYLHMVKIGAQNEEGDLYSQFIGKLSKDDILEDEE